MEVQGSVSGSLLVLNTFILEKRILPPLKVPTKLPLTGRDEAPTHLHISKPLLARHSSYHDNRGLASRQSRQLPVEELRHITTTTVPSD